MFDWVLITPLASLVCVSLLVMIITTLASCDQFIFDISFYMLFQYVYFANFETEFREIVHSWHINKITCLNERIFPVILYSQLIFFRFSINCIKALIRIMMMEMAVEQVVVVAAIVMNKLAIILLMPACSSDIKTKVFLQTRIVTVL